MSPTESQRVTATVIRLQELYVRLIFSEPIREQWKANPEQVMETFGLPHGVCRALPDLGSVSFKAECYGRRMLIAREIKPRFSRTLAQLLGPNANAEALAASSIFAEFLESEYFLTSRFSLPHRYGIGPGYETVSKFYFWLRETHGLQSAACDDQLRLSTHTDFAMHMLGQAAHTNTYPLLLAKHGVAFLEYPGVTDIWWILTTDFRLARVQVENIAAFMANRLLFLDRISGAGIYIESQLFY